MLVLPALFIWQKLFKPLTVVFYKALLVVRARSKSFFHAEHKLLAIVTHRFAIHAVVGTMTLTVVLVNVRQAGAVRSEDFADGSLVASVFSKEELTVITADSVRQAQVRYVDVSAAVSKQDGISRSADVGDNGSFFAEQGGAFVSTSTIGGVRGTTREDIQKYVVQEGDTISTIADKYGVSTKTVMWSNNLTDDQAKRVRTGDTLWILPVTGVAHNVKSGETVSSIAQKYNASEDKIIEFNNLLGAEDLIAGVEIIVPDGEQPAPPPPTPTTTRVATFQQVFTQSGGTPAANAAVSGTKLQWPTTTHRISQYYGYRHTGIDVDGEFGDAIYAAEGGTVRSAGWYSGYGLQVVIDHGGGLTTRYAHLQKVFVSAGQSVGRGQTLGEEGSTGNSTGSHLHFEVMVNGGFTNPFGYY